METQDPSHRSLVYLRRQRTWLALGVSIRGAPRVVVVDSIMVVVAADTAKGVVAVVRGRGQGGSNIDGNSRNIMVKVEVVGGHGETITPRGDTKRILSRKGKPGCLKGMV